MVRTIHAGQAYTMLIIGVDIHHSVKLFEELRQTNGNVQWCWFSCTMLMVLPGIDHTKNLLEYLKRTDQEFDRAAHHNRTPTYDGYTQAGGVNHTVENEQHTSKTMVVLMPNNTNHGSESTLGTSAPGMAGQYSQAIRHKKFEQSRRRAGLDAAPSAEDFRSAQAVGLVLNPNYKGDVTTYSLRNAGCTPEENSSVRIEGINPDATVAEIFESIQEGPIFNFSRNPPHLPRYPDAAANVVFKTAQAAQAFIRRSLLRGVWIRNESVRVMPNRNMCRGFTDLGDKSSRVLHVYGPSYYISAANVLRYFHQWVAFDAVECYESSPDQFGSTMVTVVFESIYGQSRQAKRCFEDNWLKTETGEPRNQDCVIFYGQDPCDPDPNYYTGGTMGHSSNAGVTPTPGGA